MAASTSVLTLRAGSTSLTVWAGSTTWAGLTSWEGSAGSTAHVWLALSKGSVARLLDTSVCARWNKQQNIKPNLCCFVIKLSYITFL